MRSKVADNDLWDYASTSLPPDLGDVRRLGTAPPSAERSKTPAADLHRLRWRIELPSERMRALLEIDGLRSRERLSAKVFILVKRITGFLALRLSEESEALSPYGYDIGNIRPTSEPSAAIQVRTRRGRHRHPRHRMLDKEAHVHHDFRPRRRKSRIQFDDLTSTQQSLFQHQRRSP